MLPSPHRLRKFASVNPVIGIIDIEDHRGVIDAVEKDFPLYRRISSREIPVLLIQHDLKDQSYDQRMTVATSYLDIPRPTSIWRCIPREETTYSELCPFNTPLVSEADGMLHQSKMTLFSTASARAFAFLAATFRLKVHAHPLFEKEQLSMVLHMAASFGKLKTIAGSREEGSRRKRKRLLK